MLKKRPALTIGGLMVTLSLLAACSSSTAATTVSTIAPTAVRTAAASAATALTSAASSAVATAVSTPAASASASSAASSSAAGTPTTAASPTRAASPATSGTPATPGTPSGTPSGNLVPGQAYSKLQSQGSHRQKWVFSGFNVGGLTGDLQPTFDVNGSNRKVTIPNTFGITLVAYQVNGTISVPNPVGGGYSSANTSNPLSAPVQALFALPDTLVTNLAPAGANYTAQGSQNVNGRATTAYRTQVTLNDLGFVDPSLQGQRGSAVTTVYLDNTGGFLVAMESTITADSSGTTAKARLDVTDIGQVPAITLP